VTFVVPFGQQYMHQSRVYSRHHFINENGF